MKTSPYGQFRKGALLVLIGLLTNFAETWYFGWNLLPQSPAEMAWDYFCMFLIVLGGLMTIGAGIRAKSQATDAYKALARELHRVNGQG